MSNCLGEVVLVMHLVLTLTGLVGLRRPVEHTVMALAEQILGMIDSSLVRSHVLRVLLGSHVD